MSNGAGSEPCQESLHSSVLGREAELDGVEDEGKEMDLKEGWLERRRLVPAGATAIVSPNSLGPEYRIARLATLQCGRVPRTMNSPAALSLLGTVTGPVRRDRRSGGSRARGMHGSIYPSDASIGGPGDPRWVVGTGCGDAQCVEKGGDKPLHPL